MKGYRRSKKQSPPYKGSIEVPIGHSTVRVKLPPVNEYEVGAKAAVEGKYKDRPFTVNLIRIEGGWDLKQ